MFVFNRSAAAVILPLALLVAVVLFSNRESTPRPESTQAATVSNSMTVAQVDSAVHEGG
jgi:hypothetical protein